MLANVERMIRFCSELTVTVGYPYFFTWSLPFHHYIEPRKEVENPEKIVFRVGRYYKMQKTVKVGRWPFSKERKSIVGLFPVESIIEVDRVDRIVDGFRPLTAIVDPEGKASEIRFGSLREIRDDLPEFKAAINRSLDQIASAFKEMNVHNTELLTGPENCPTREDEKRYPVNLYK